MAITKIQSESLNLADTYAFTGTVTGAGGVNTPAFAVHISSSQSLSDNTNTKVQFNTEIYDTDSAFDNSTNYRFTVPSGKAGKYFFNVNFYFQGVTQNDYKRFQIQYKKNGGDLSLPGSLHYARENYSNFMRADGKSSSIILDLSVSDYIEVFALQDNSSSSTRNIEQAYFQGYKIIE